MHGVSGSGKSYVAKEIARNINAVILRADAIRKHITSTKLNDDKADIYSEAISSKLYTHLCNKALVLSDVGMDVIVDASFLKSQNRKYFIKRLKFHDVRTKILSVEVDNDVARERIRKRVGDVSDANERILDFQIENFEQFTVEESQLLIKCWNNEPFKFSQITSQLL
jgi:predicted kinase